MNGHKYRAIQWYCHNQGLGVRASHCAVTAEGSRCSLPPGCRSRDEVMTRRIITTTMLVITVMKRARVPKAERAEAYIDHVSPFSIPVKVLASQPECVESKKPNKLNKMHARLRIHCCAKFSEHRTLHYIRSRPIKPNHPFLSSYHHHLGVFPRSLAAL